MDNNEYFSNKPLKIFDYKLLGKLPNPFIFNNGKQVSTISDWEERKKEIYKTAIELQYGILPPKPEFLEVETLYTSKNVCDYKIHTGTYKNPISFKMQVLLPQTKEEKYPFIVNGDMCWMYHLSHDFIYSALDNGIGWVYFDRTEIAHDIYRQERGKGAIYNTYPDYNFGSIAAWAWGYSRCVDALEKLDLPVDFNYLTFTGHSRGGKTCALAGALDERCKIVNPNETCAGSCSCYRIHISGQYENDPPFRSETLKDLWNNFSSWISPEMEKYIDCEEQLPFDAHYLKALIAPRILFISEAAGDLWSNPIGSYQTTLASKEVYKFLGKENNLYWYFRPGTHAHTPLDIQMLVNVILHVKNGTEIDNRMFILPFKETELSFDWKSPK